jgi:hypothetical protein
MNTLGQFQKFFIYIMTCQFYRWRNTAYPGDETSNLPQVIDEPYHIMFNLVHLAIGGSLNVNLE